jgi:hypothetical protein
MAVMTETEPTLPAFRHPDGVHALVWCQHCNRFHAHRAVMGHKNAHCAATGSPYRDTGYTIIDAGPASGELLALYQKMGSQQQQRRRMSSF